MTVPTLTRLDTCPSCGGCFPGDGPRVCCCGSDWGPPLMAAMADHPDDPPRLAVDEPATEWTDTTEETPDHG